MGAFDLICDHEQRYWLYDYYRDEQRGYVSWKSGCVMCDLERAKERLAAAEADAARWRYVRDNATLAGETQDGVYLWEFEALDMNPDSIEADVDASIEAAKAGGVE